MLIARRMQNNQVENYLPSDGTLVRANTGEARWRIKAAFARRTMKG